MNIELRSILDRGEIKKERITLRVLRDCDAGDFLLMRTAVIGDQFTAEVSNAYWFPYTPVASGDLVVIYTKTGAPRTKALSTGKVAHFFYWGSREPIWSEADRAAVLLFAPEWEGKSASELER